MLDERRARLRRAAPIRVRPRTALLMAHRELIIAEGSGTRSVRAARTHKRLHPAVIGALAVAVAVITVVAIESESFFYLLYITVSLVFGAIAMTTLVWMLDAWHIPGSVGENRAGRGDLPPTHSFSLIVPARHEEAVLQATLSRLVTSDHPAFEVLVVVGSDDAATLEAASVVAHRHPDLVRVIVDSSWPKNKPKALNAALPYCTGGVTGVFDAEDVVDPRLLRRIDKCFQENDADVVQAGVQLMNFRSSWLAVRNCLEYYFWFRSRLHLHARQRFIPLGGNTVFVRTELLRAVSGWDPDCLAEDCELGVRLSALGAKTVVVYEPELVTREECPAGLRAFVRQRTRWNQGYLQTLLKGCWRGLPLRQRAVGVYILAMPYLLAVAWLMIPLALVTIVAVRAPVMITLISFLPVVPMLSMLAVELIGLGDFCGAYGERASRRDYARVAFGLPVYQFVLAFAAVRAVFREVRGIHLWEKTVHLGLHFAERFQGEVSTAYDAMRRASRRTRMRCEGRIRTATERPLRVRSQSEPAKPWLGPVDHDRSEKRLFDTIDMRGDGVRRPHHGAKGANGAGSWADRDRTRRVLDRPSAALGQATANGSLTQPLPGAPRAPAAMGGGWLRHLRPGAARTLAAHADVAVQVLLLAAIGIVTATNLLHWPDTQFDEGTYVSYAWAVQHGALANYTYGYGHPPLGWLLIFVWTWASTLVGHESFSIDTARQLMLVISLISCSLLYALARRLGIGRVFAAAGVMVFALSPIALFYHRQVLLDNPAIAWALAAFVLARTPRRRLWAFAASGACFAASVLSKETTLVLLPALFLAAFQNTDRRTRRYCVTLFVSFFVLLGLAYPLYAALKGELLPGKGHVSLLGEAVVQLISRQSTGSILNPHSQTRAIVTAWLQLDPWLLGGAIVLLPIAFVRRSTRSIALAFVIGLVMVVRPGYLPNMYVLALLPFGALILAGSLDALWRFTAARARGPLTVAASALTLCGLTGLAVFHVAPRWVRADRTAMTLRQDAARRAAERWIVEHVGRDKRLIVSDDFWVYLVEHGFDHQAVRGGFYSRTVVFYWPLDYDPAVKRRFPDGWRDFDYVVSVQGMRNTLNQTPTTAAALVHSRVVASFGRGAARIEIRAIDRPAPPG